MKYIVNVVLWGALNLTLTVGCRVDILSWQFWAVELCTFLLCLVAATW
jgi:hypothetical protein